MENFDPYLKWLGIHPKDQPPNHYRLLGIELFEQDQDVIAAAADGRMAHIKQFQTGRYAEISQKLLNEIAAARLCLLTPEKKQQYDMQLRQQLAASKLAPPVPPPAGLPRGQPPVRPTAAAEVPIPRTASRSRSAVRWKLIGLAIGGTVLVIAVWVAAFHLTGGFGKSQQASSANDQRDSGTVELASSAERTGENTDPTPAEVGASKQSERPDGTTGQMPSEDQPNQRASANDGQPRELASSGSTTPAALMPLVDANRNLADLIDPGSAEEVAVMAAGDSGSSPKGSRGQVAARVPVPDAAAQQAAERRVMAVFEKELKGAKTSEQHAALAEKLLAQAAENAADKPLQYVCLRLAIDQAIAGDNMVKAMEIVDKIAESFEQEALPTKARVLEETLKSLRPGPQAPNMVIQILYLATDLIDVAMAEDDFDAAGRLLKIASGIAGRLRDKALERELTVNRKRELDQQKTKYVAVKKAQEALQANADDADANLIVGRWLCFVKGDWARGLPYLAKGSDEKLAQLARTDAANPTEAKEQLALADRWWEVGDKEQGSSALIVKQRAAQWYSQALPQLTGLEKAKAEQRLQELSAALEKDSSKFRAGVVKVGNVALATNGAQCAGPGRTSVLIDGRVDQTGEWYIWGVTPCTWLVTLDKLYRLSEIRIKLYDGPHRGRQGYRFVLSVSADGKNYEVVADCSKVELIGWQRVSFRPRPVQYIKFDALPDPASQLQKKESHCHICEIEAYCIPPAFLPHP